jgi:hypothetical protein
MHDFTASNGTAIEVNSLDPDRLVIHPSRVSATLMIHPPEVAALREFFRAEEDERLGRWRWPENPDYVVYSGFDDSDRDAARVLHEPSLGKVIVARGEVARRRGVWDEEVTNPHWHAARAYFDAHPEPKPWHDAKCGESWHLEPFSVVYTVMDGTRPGKPRGLWFTRANVYGAVENVDLDDYRIISARRIWPADD